MKSATDGSMGHQYVLVLLSNKNKTKNDDYSTTTESK